MVTKGEMQTFFAEGQAFPVTFLWGKEGKLAEAFKEGDRVTLSGISKGKGFAGVVKRHHFQGGPRTHGQSDRESPRLHRIDHYPRTGFKREKNGRTNGRRKSNGQEFIDSEN